MPSNGGSDVEPVASDEMQAQERLRDLERLRRSSNRGMWIEIAMAVAVVLFIAAIVALLLFT